MSVNDSITYLKGVGTVKAEVLSKELGIHSVSDLIYYFPFRYVDRSKFYKINEIRPTKTDLQILGKITHIKTVEFKRGQRLEATFQDETGSIKLVWFKSINWFKKHLKLHTLYVIYGRVQQFMNEYSVVHPEIDLWSEFQQRQSIGLQPVYSSTELLQKKSITNRFMRQIIHNALNKYLHLYEEILPASIIRDYRLTDRKTALMQVHFPKNQEALSHALHRLKFEELFFIQLQLLQLNLLHKKKIRGYTFSRIGELFHQFYEQHLPFTLTGAQKKVIKEIRKDLGSGAQMNRLLQGDVGSGKTIVALFAALIALDNGYQTAFMAPTEILARQHAQSIAKFLKDMPVKTSLLTGSTSTRERKIIHEELESGDLQILIGTHALIEDKVKFHNLGLVIIDEQHRFGVAQRAKMWKKNTRPPHILVMTATPIPRTLAMTLYGDLDVSVIDELPPGRKPIKTIWRNERNRNEVFSFIRQQLDQKRQAYIVFPLIEESEVLDYENLMDGYERVKRFFGSSYSTGLVHGKMKPAEKDEEMRKFVRRETQILVATTVIEVGVDVPNANIMLIESAEKFGLSQLHQLRGRVGRGAAQSYCILLSGNKVSENAKIRLQTMTQTNDGFKIAETDLKLRGPGNMMGTQQSGVLNFKVADIIKDNRILLMARQAAKNIIYQDPDLTLPENINLKKVLADIQKKQGFWGYIS